MSGLEGWVGKEWGNNGSMSTFATNHHLQGRGEVWAGKASRWETPNRGWRVRWQEVTFGSTAGPLRNPVTNLWFFLREKDMLLLCHMHLLWSLSPGGRYCVGVTWLGCCRWRRSSKAGPWAFKSNKTHQLATGEWMECPGNPCSLALRPDLSDWPHHSNRSPHLGLLNSSEIREAIPLLRGAWAQSSLTQWEGKASTGCLFS
jgi:hypothetical protein